VRMFEISALLALGGIVSLVLLGRIVAKFLSRRESASPWFKDNVGTDYTLEFPDKERSQYDELQSLIRQKHDPDGQDPEWHRSCTDPEINILLGSLKNVMVKSISNLAQLQKDRPGCYKLWRGKLISEGYWESLQLCEGEVNEDIALTLKEVNRLRPGIGDRFFEECVGLWKGQLRKTAEEEEVAKQAEAQRLAAIEEKRQAERDVVQARREEREREKMMQALILEEERERAKAAKKRKAARGGRN